MPALLLLALIAPLLAGCVPGGVRSDGVPTVDAPFTLVALDVGQPTFSIRFMARRQSHQRCITLQLEAA
jgi:hypothetical protein